MVAGADHPGAGGGVLVHDFSSTNGLLQCCFLLLGRGWEEGCNARGNRDARRPARRCPRLCCHPRQPAFTLGAVANVDFRGSSWRPRYGLFAAVETFRNLRWGGVGIASLQWNQGERLLSSCPPVPLPLISYERSAAGQKMSGARLTQRHVASAEDLAYHEGKGLLVPLQASYDRW